MRMKASLFFGALLLTCCATTASAVQWPNPANPADPADTLRRVEYTQNAALAPQFAATGDTVWGVSGIVTAFDTFPTGFAIYIQNSDGSPFSGVDVFTGGTNYKGRFAGGLQRGDSVVVYGRLAEFASETEIAGFVPASQFADPLPGVRRISSGKPLPPFHIMTVAEAKETTPAATGEPWEGALVRIPTKVRVARTVGLGFGNQLVVDDACTVAPCDSVLVDGATLSFYAFTYPAVGALADSVQGVYKQATPRGYRLMLRDPNDSFDNLPPRIVDAYSITQDSVEVVFDRALTQASAENLANYTITSALGPPLGAKQQVAKNIVHLLSGSSAATGTDETVTVNGLVRDWPGNPTMTAAASRTWVNGITPIATIQAPALSGGNVVCPDRSAYAPATGSGIGTRRVTTRGVSTLQYGSTSFLQTAAGGLRSGLQVFAPQSPLDVGHQYTIVTQIQEFFTETQGSGTLFIRDEGLVAAPAPAVVTIGALRDSTCDLTQSLSNLEDYEDMLVQVQNVKIVEDRLVGQSFGIAGPSPGFTDSILVDNNVPRTFDPSVETGVNVTGVIENASSVNFGIQWRLQPRGNSDITTPSTGVGGQNPAEISFAVSPNPARVTRVTFALPKRDHVQIAIYDLAGRRRAVLADGEYPAGTHSLDWNGMDADGKSVGAGVYFYKLQIGGQTFNRRGILLN